MTISIIAAMDSKMGIGKDNGMPWHISEDLRRFKTITLGHPVIMGRKTFESIGRSLPDRQNIIITRDQNFKAEDSDVVHSLEDAQRIARDNEVFIIGGGQIFKKALEKKMVDKLYLTIIDGDFEADTFFPDYSNFKIVSEEEGQSGEYKYKFVNLVRK